MIVLLLGPHGAGKTSLGRSLSALSGWTFHDEIGKDLASDPSHRASEVQVHHRQPSFDREVFAREVARDLAFEAEGSCGVRIVETWHPGNLAYATRSPEVVLATLPCLRDSIAWSRVVVVPVTASPDLLETRKTYPEPLAYFLRIAAISLAIANGFGAHIKEPVITSRNTPDGIAAALLPSLEGLARRMRARPTASRLTPV